MLGTMPRKKPKAEPEPRTDRHKNAVVSFRPDAPLRAAIQELAEAERRSVAQVVEILLEEALAARKLWPRPPAPQS